MNALRAVFRLGLLTGLAIQAQGRSAIAQAPSTNKSQTTAPGLRRLTGDDARRAEELVKAINAALSADRWDEAIAQEKELLALRLRVQGRKHFDAVNADWLLKAHKRVARLTHEDRVAYQSTDAIYKQASTVEAQGKYAEARPLFEKALAIQRRLLSDDHPFTATMYDRLALTLDAQARYAEAEPLHQKALEIRSRLLTDDHPAIAESYNNSALNLHSQGKYAKAQPLFEKALEIHRRLLTDLHPDTATSYNNVAMNLNARGKYAQAEPLLKEALEIRRRVLTDLHPDTAQSYNNVASNLSSQVKHAQAQPLFEKALEIRRRVLTDDHPDTASSYDGVAGNLTSQGKYAEAQPFFEKALELRRRLLTDDHPDTAQSYNSVASNLAYQGKYAAALPLHEKTLEIDRRLLTDLHPVTARDYNNVASVLDDQGKHSHAQPLYEKALEIRRRLLTDLHPDTATGYNNVAYNLNAQGKYAVAQPLFEKALEIRRRLLTDLHPDTAGSYINVAYNFNLQGKYAVAQPLFEKALEINRGLLGDDHPRVATSYFSLAENLKSQGNYSAAQPMFEKALEIRRRRLTDDHPTTARSHDYLAYNLAALGKYVEARDQWLRASKSARAARLRVAFTGLDRAGAVRSTHPALAAVLARVGQPAEAWLRLEEDLGRGLLDELAARADRRLAPEERTRLRELTSELERLDKLDESTPTGLAQAERAKRFDDLKRQHDLASIALGEFQTKLAQAHGPLAGQVAGLDEIQLALPEAAALVMWVDIPPVGPSAADPDGDHWGVVVRSRGVPAWISIAGTGKDGLWTREDVVLAERVQDGLRRRPGTSPADLRPLLEKLRAQRLEPLTKALSARLLTPPSTDGQPPAGRLIVLPSRAMAGIPLEALLAPDDTRTISYAPSATVLKYLREQPRPGRHAGLLALGDPVYERPGKSSDPQPLPDRGLLINVVAPGSNAATHGLKLGDVLLTYNGIALKNKDDFKVVVTGQQPVGVDVWRDGQALRRELAPGKLGVVLDSRPAREAIAANRGVKKMLVAAHRGGEEFAPLPGTRFEVEAIASLFKSDDRPTRILVGADASELETDRLASSGELSQFGFIHLATHGVIDESIPARSAVILTQTGLPDPLEQALSHKPVFDGRLSVREIQHGWDLKAGLVTLSACETALGREAGGEGFVGFTQALLMSGARSVCLSLWKVDDTATALLMRRFYANMLGRRSGLSGPMPKAEALREAKFWLRALRRAEALALTAELSGGVARSKGAKARQPDEVAAAVPAGGDNDRPYAAPYYWAAFVLVGDPD